MAKKDFANRTLAQGLLVAMSLLFALSASYSAGAQSVVTTRDSVGRLFYSASEREVLEAVRQGVVDQSITEQDEIITTAPISVPQIVFKSSIRKTSTGRGFTRELDLNYNGFIRKAGEESDTRLLIDGNIIDAEEQEILKESLGLNFRGDEIQGPILFVEDNLFKQKIAFRRGDVLKADGSVERQYPNDGRFIIVKRGSK